MKDKGLPEIRIKDTSVVLSGGFVSLRSEDGHIVLNHKGRDIHTSMRFDIKTSKNGNDCVKFNHMPHKNQIVIHNNSENTHIRWGANETRPGLRLNVSTSHLDKDQEDIIFRNKSNNQSFRVHLKDQYTRTENEKDSDTINRVINTPEVKDSRSIEEKDLKTILSRTPDAENLGSGVSRSVFKIDASKVNALTEDDGSIIKVADRPEAKEINRLEVQTWQAVKNTEHRKFFCPITSIGKNHKYIIMKEANSIGQLDKNIINNIRKEIIGRISTEEEGYQLGNPEVQSHYDIHGSNVGTYQGETVLIDYPFGGKFNPKGSKDEDSIAQKLLNILK